MKKQLIVDIICPLIIIMFLYASFSKYFDWPAFDRAMSSQPFKLWFAHVLMITIPPLEIITALMLIFDKTKYYGFLSSTALMLAFTIYIASILLGFFPRTPCSCGGIIRSLGWTQHLIFNILFLAISVLGAVMQKSVINKNTPSFKEG